MLTTAQVAAMLMSFHDVEPRQASKFSARLKELKKLNWPQGSRLGRGVKAAYSLNAILELALCFELLQVGVSHERAVHVLSVLWRSIRADAARIAASPEEPYFLAFDPKALHYYTDHDLFHFHYRAGRVENDPTLETSWGGPARDFLTSLTGADGAGRRTRRVVIDLAALVSAITVWLESEHGLSAANLLREMAGWPDADAACDQELYGLIAAGKLEDEQGRIERRISQDYWPAVQDAYLAARGIDLSAPGLKTARRICQAWHFDEVETATLLGVPSRADLDTLLGRDQMERISVVLHIARLLLVVRPDPEEAFAWPNAHNNAFGGARPTSIMRARPEGLRRVRDHLAAKVAQKEGSGPA